MYPFKPRARITLSKFKFLLVGSSLSVRWKITITTCLGFFQPRYLRVGRLPEGWLGILRANTPVSRAEVAEGIVAEF